MKKHMQIAIISDIHGNCLAFDAALADLRRQAIDQIVCLGDAVQGGPQPVEVVARLRDLAGPVVMGNADAWLLSGQETGNEPISPERRIELDAVREWSLSQLSPADHAFIGAFQPTVSVTAETGQQLLCFHGSPASFDDVILPSTPAAEFQRLLGGQAASIFTGGHTHLQWLRRLGDGFYFNPGSIDGTHNHEQDDSGFRADAWAEYAVLTLEAGRLGLEFRRVPYDAGALIQIYRSSGRPYADDAAAQYGTA